ncbi:IS3 family transposase [Eubacteriales bacterium OttesenSCG-928-N14]|nr:IS3 family transposase [Eubacteriales bacterium OttesenSCG-928-N14]
MPAHLHATTKMKYEMIQTHSPEFSVRKMCKVLGLTTTAYYNWAKRSPSREKKQKEKEKLAKKVRKVFKANKEVYGYRKMQKALERKGIELSIYKVRRIMQENGMYSVSTEKFKPPRRKNPEGRFCENLVEQRFNPTAPNEVWAGDITYIRTKIGWVYLSAVMDLHNREIIGYAISKSIDTELVKRSLSNALTNRNGGGENTIFHSDRGIQYASKTYQKMLEENGIKGSMSRSSCPYDNACLESFFSSAKRECILRKEYNTLEEVKRDLFEYIELFYNRRRMHQSLGYMTPVEYRLAWMNNKVA